MSSSVGCGRHLPSCGRCGECLHLCICTCHGLWCDLNMCQILKSSSNLQVWGFSPSHAVLVLLGPLFVLEYATFWYRTACTSSTLHIDETSPRSFLLSCVACWLSQQVHWTLSSHRFFFFFFFASFQVECNSRLNPTKTTLLKVGCLLSHSFSLAIFIYLPI